MNTFIRIKGNNNTVWLNVSHIVSARKGAFGDWTVITTIAGETFDIDAHLEDFMEELGQPLGGTYDTYK